MNRTKTHPEKKPVITQPMIRLYDDYTHLTLDRRDFMRKLDRARRLRRRGGGDRAHAGGELRRAPRSSRRTIRA